MSASMLRHRPAQDFVHEALFYEGVGDAVSCLAPFVREGVEAGEPTLVAVPAATLELLCDELGPAAAHVTFLDIEQVGTNPARITGIWHDWTVSHRGQSARGVGEPVWVGRSGPEMAECNGHERLLDLACEDSRLWLVCPYDTSSLPADALAIAQETHRDIVAGDSREPSSAFVAGWDDILTVPLDEPAGPTLDLDVEFSAHPAEVRRHAEQQAAAAGLQRDKAEAFVMAVNELASNSLRHGSGAGRFRTWHDHDSVVAEIRDSGRITQPLAGRLQPGADAESGRGLWIVHQLCDLVQVRSGADGTTVRLHMRLNGS